MIHTATIPNRTDWRFLFPTDGKTSAHAFVVGEYDATIEATLDTMARQVSFGEVPPTPVDWVWVRHTYPLLEIASLATALNDGGVLYWEFKRNALDRGRTPPFSIKAILKKYGLREVRTYGVLPNF
jgi:hypothetical protein